jgi:chaperonin GroES
MVKSEINITNAQSVPTFYPIFGKVVIKVEDVKERRYGQLYLPQSSAARSSIGIIHAVYEPEDTPDGRVEPQVKVGDTVIFGQFTGTVVTVGKEMYIICKEHDLLTIVEFADTPVVEAI